MSTMMITKAMPLSREELIPLNIYHHTNITPEMTSGLKRLLDSGRNETAIHRYLTEYPELLYRALYKTSTGHHKMKILSKQSLIPKSPESKGMIPDFILGAKSSEGWGWFVIELKGYNDPLFSISKSEIGLSSIANKGVCQILEYIDKSTEIQSHIRDMFKLEDFRNPKGILLLGKKSEIEDEPRKKNLRRMFHEMMPDVMLLSYDCLI